MTVAQRPANLPPSNRHSTKPRNFIGTPLAASFQRQMFRQTTRSPSAIISSMAMCMRGMRSHIARIMFSSS